MTSIISKIQSNGLLVLVFAVVAAVVLVSCENTPPQPATKTRIVTTSTQAEPQEQPKSPPTGNTAPAEKSDEKEPPYFGSTYWDELLTSVYYYPDSKATHLKFNHRDDEVWLCGDQRRSFEPGSRVKLLVTFEPNAPCITNWKIK